VTKRPPNAGKGRKKGVPNKYTGALKDMILQALANVGGVAYLEEQARKQPAQFLGLVGRVLPLQVKQDGNDPMVPAVVVHQHLSGEEPVTLLSANTQKD
jgi:hypothetical protein